jgi:hypothetical protein
MFKLSVVRLETKNPLKIQRIPKALINTMLYSAEYFIA